MINENTTKMKSIKVTISIRDCVLAWNIINDRFRDEIERENSTSEDIIFLQEDDADQFIGIMEDNGLEVWSDDLEKINN